MDVLTGTHTSAAENNSNGKRMYKMANGQSVELPADMSAEEAAKLEAEGNAAQKKLKGAKPKPTPDVKEKAKLKNKKEGKIKPKGKKGAGGKLGGSKSKGGKKDSKGAKGIKGKVGAWLMAKGAPSIARGQSKLQQLKTNEQKHDNAGTKLSQITKAVVPPVIEGQSTSNAGQVDTVESKPVPEPNEAVAKQTLTSAIADNIPQNIEDVDNFKKNNKAGLMSSAVSIVVNKDKNEVAGTFGDMKQTPAPVKSDVKPEELPPEEIAPSTAKMNLGTDTIAPLQKEHTDVSKYTKEADSKLKDEGVTQDQLDMVDSGDLAEANKEKKGMEKKAKTEPLAVTQFAQQANKKVDAELQQEENKGRDEIKNKRKEKLSATKLKQQGTKTEIEKKREDVANKINGIYKRAQEKVTKKLADLETVAIKRFDDGNAKATKAFEDTVKIELDAFKDDRYSGMWGWARKAKDWLLGMEDLPRVKAIFDNNRSIFVNTINALVETITQDNKKVIQECKDELTAARTEIKDFVSKLGPELMDAGKKAADDMNSQLDELDKTINKKEEELQNKLKDKQAAAIKAIDEKIEKMKEAMSGALSKLGKLLLLAAKKFFSWALEKFGFSLAEIDSIINKGAAVLKAIFTQPIQFVKNLMNAAITGFKNFGKNFLKHLKDALFEWLTGSLEGLTLPKVWDFKGIISIGLQMIGISYANIRKHMVTVMGENVVGGLEKTFTLVKTLITEGPMAAWEQLKEMAGEMRDAFVDAVKDFIKTKIIEQAITWIVGIFVPGAGIVKAIIGIYDTIVFFINKAKQIMQMISNFLGSIGSIAAGNIGAAADAMENGLARGLSLVINFLAQLLHLNGITDKIRNAIQKIRDKVDIVLLKVAKWIAEKAKGLFSKVVSAGTPADPQERVDEGVRVAVAAVNKLNGNKIGKAVINPVLSLIKTRYQMQSLEAIEQGGKWAIKGVVNPVRVTLSDKEIAEQKAQSDTFVEAFKPAFGGDEVQSKAFLTKIKGDYEHSAVVSLEDATKKVAPIDLVKFMLGLPKPPYKISTVAANASLIQFKYVGLAYDGGKVVDNYDSTTSSVNIAELDKKNELSFDFFIPMPVRAMGVRGVGKDMFNMSFKHFKPNVDSIKTLWLVLNPAIYPPDGLSDNLKAFILNYNPSSDNKVEAAKAAWTSGMIAKLADPGGENVTYEIKSPADVKMVAGAGIGMRFDKATHAWVKTVGTGEFGVKEVEAKFSKK